MSKEITRTFTITKVSYMILVKGEDGEAKTEVREEILNGEHDAESAGKVLTRQIGGLPLITGCEVISEVRGMSVDEFYKNSHVVIRPASQQKKVEEPEETEETEG